MAHRRITSAPCKSPAAVSSSRAFTIVELLVVIAIIGLLLALILPAVQRAREAARCMMCKKNLHQLSIALHNYEATHGTFPPGSQVIDFSQSPGYSKSIGWTVALLPFLEQQALYRQFDLNLDCQIHNRDLTRRKVTAFICPSDPVDGGPIEWKHPRGPHPIWGAYDAGGWGTTNYFGVSGIGGLQQSYSLDDCERFHALSGRNQLHSGMFFGNSHVRLSDISDGTSNTFMLAERGVVDDWGKWGGAGILFGCPYGIFDVTMPGVIDATGGGGLRAPKQSPSDRLFLWSWHNGGSHYSLADGSVRMLSYSLDHSLQTKLTTRDHGEVIGEW